MDTMQAKILKRDWVVEWFDERQCYHMPSLTRAANGNLLAVWNGGFLQWNGDPMGRDAKDWVSILEPGAEHWSNRTLSATTSVTAAMTRSLCRTGKAKFIFYLRKIPRYRSELCNVVQRP